MIIRDRLRVLLVEDDEDDYILTRDLFGEIKGQIVNLEWRQTYSAGLETMKCNQHDVCLIDFRLGARNGIELLEEALNAGCRSPIILLTGQGERDIDIAAMKSGAADYLVKSKLDAGLLERSIRYAIERKRAADIAAADQARLAAFGAHVGLALTRRDSLEGILEDCAEAMVNYLDAALARVWRYDAEENVLRLEAFAGCYDYDKSTSDLKSITLSLDTFKSNDPTLKNDLAGDTRVPDAEWARSEGIRAYAGYPLVLEDRLVGLMCVFTRTPATNVTLQDMGSVANGIASCIERKRAEAEIKKLVAFPQYNPEPVMELTEEGSVSYFNNAAKEKAESLGLVAPGAMLPPNAAGIAGECLRSGRQRLRQETSINGRSIAWSFFPIKANRVVHCYGTDITERLDLELQLRHSQKMESIGQLAAGVAHDFNNILTIVQGYTERLIGQHEEDDKLTRPLRQVFAAAKRASNLTRQLLTFSRKQVIRREPLCLNDILSSMQKMLPRLLGEDITLRFRYEKELPAIKADVGMIEQIIMNLAVNARDAMPKGGWLEITTSLQQIEIDYTRKNPDARVGNFVCMKVRDDGTGMSSETISRIFEPFYTTKEAGKGTGLGLATVYGIVKQHDGWIEVESKCGEGTTFEVFLPVCGELKTPRKEPSEQNGIKGGSETILVVEDEPVLLLLAREILEDYNYNVLVASSGVKAKQVWAQHEGEIDLLVTDMVMPEGVSGKELATTLKGHKPKLKVIVTSGYSQDVIDGDNDDLYSLFLPKPYPPQQLAKSVRDILDLPEELGTDLRGTNGAVAPSPPRTESPVSAPETA